LFIKNACGLGLQDELLWGAAWLYKATSDNAYLNYLIGNREGMEGSLMMGTIFGWDSKYAGFQVLLSKVRKSQTVLPFFKELL
jgi:hypothetical protein